MQETKKTMISSHAESNMPYADWINSMNEWGKSRIPFFFLLDFELEKPVVLPLSEIDQDKFKFSIGNHHVDKTSEGFGERNMVDKNPISFEQYQAGFEKVMEAIQGGDTYLLNLC